MRDNEPTDYWKANTEKEGVNPVKVGLCCIVAALTNRTSPSAFLKLAAGTLACYSAGSSPSLVRLNPEHLDPALCSPLAAITYLHSALAAHPFTPAWHGTGRPVCLMGTVATQMHMIMRLDLIKRMLRADSPSRVPANFTSLECEPEVALAQAVYVHPEKVVWYSLSSPIETSVLGHCRIPSPSSAS